MTLRIFKARTFLFVRKLDAAQTLDARQMMLWFNIVR
jgi:hypothetical protein